MTHDQARVSAEFDYTLLETHGCQGGAHGGYTRAGWRVTGNDIKAAHARYYPGELIIGDAATVIREHGLSFDAVHTSPPCQWYCRGNAPRRGQETKWERTIPPIREALESTRKLYVIENVKDAVWDLRDPIMICGCMFDLSVLDFTCTSLGEHAGTCDTDNGVRVHLQRPRLFEVNWHIPGLIEQTFEAKDGDGIKREWTVRSPRACDHSAHEWVAGAYGGARRDKYEAKYIRKGGYVPPNKALVQELLGFTAADRAGRPDQTWEGLFECLPPAYTEWIGTHLRNHVESTQEAAA